MVMVMVMVIEAFLGGQPFSYQEILKSNLNEIEGVVVLSVPG